MKYIMMHQYCYWISKSNNVACTTDSWKFFYIFVFFVCLRYFYSLFCFVFKFIFCSFILFYLFWLLRPSEARSFFFRPLPLEADWHCRKAVLLTRIVCTAQSERFKCSEASKMTKIVRFNIKTLRVNVSNAQKHQKWPK